MPGGSTIQELNRVLNYNKNLLKKNNLFTNRKTYTKIKARYVEKSKDKEFKKLSEKELYEIRSKIKAEQTKNLIFISISTLIISVMVVYFAVSFINSFSTPKISDAEKNKIANNTKQSFDFFMVDADVWLKKKNWHNAIHQYEKAIEVYPVNYKANYQLCLAYYYQCKQSQKDCNIGKQKLNQLIEIHPKNDQLIKLKKKFNNL